MNYNNLAQEAHENAVKHGFWETKDYEALRIDPAEIVAIVDKSTQQVTYDGETWNEFEKIYF